MQASRVCRRSASLLAVLAAALGGCGGGATNHASQPSSRTLQGFVLKPPKPAASLTLHNYTGSSVSLAALRGKAVLVTFIYTHCPDVCPLITANLANAQRQLGAEARHLQILAVTVDPRRDTPAAVRTFLAAHDATGRMDYLLGTRARLRRVWRAWNVGVQVDTNKPTVGHTAIVYGITASGRTAVVYPSNFTPAQITHDVPLLASS